jgi:BirA family transcriptional regulator, biotin operon repressor / biotin---[acetyl-CoA-carboxylase] ligase
LKWPNDVRVDGAKLAGILIETGYTGDTFWVAAGIGINVAHAPDAAGQRTTCLAALSHLPTPDAAQVFGVLQQRFAARLASARNGFENLRADWLRRADGLGQMVSVGQGETAIQGVFEAMDADGALVLRLPNGTSQTIRAGDIVVPERKN